MNGEQRSGAETYTPEEHGPRVGERVVFWSWMSLIAVGLTIMIAVPLAAR